MFSANCNNCSFYPEKSGLVQTDLDGDIIDRKHHVVFAKGSYTHASFIGDRFIVFQQVKEVDGLKSYDITEKKFTPFIPFEYMGDGVYRGNLSGHSNQSVFSNRIVELPASTTIERVGEGGFFFLKRADENDQYASGGRRSRVVYSIDFDRMGVMDKNLNIILPRRYTTIRKVPGHDFFLAREVVGAGEREYLFDKKGKKICEVPMYQPIVVAGSITCLSGDNQSLLINNKGIMLNARVLVSFLYPMERNNRMSKEPALLAITDSLGNTGIYDVQLKLLQPHEYHIVEERALGIVTLKKGDSLYFMNLAGNLLFGGKGFYGRNVALLEGCVAVLRNEAGKFGALNAAGEQQLPFVYDTIYKPPYSLYYLLGKGDSTWRINNIGGLVLYSVAGKDGSIPPDLLAKRVSDAIFEDGGDFVVIDRNKEGIPMGVYNRSGKMLAQMNRRLRPFPIWGNNIRRMLVTDTDATRFALIDTTGHFILPYIKMPDLVVIGKYSIVALNKTGKSFLFTFEGDGFVANEISADSAKSAKLFSDARDRKFFNGGNVYCSAPGIKHAIIFANSPPLFEKGVDSIISHEVFSDEDYLLVKKRTGWGIFENGRWLYPPDADSIVADKHFGHLWIHKGNKLGVWPFRYNGCLPPVFDTIINPQTLTINYAVAKNEGKYLLLDRKGVPLFAAYDSIDFKSSPYETRTPRGLKGYRNGIAYTLQITDAGLVEERKEGR